MGTSFSFSNRTAHFHYLSQKTSTTNPVLLHGMIKLLEPQRITRVGIQTRCRHGQTPLPGPNGRSLSIKEHELLLELEKNEEPRRSHAVALSNILKDIGEGRESQRLDPLIFDNGHISKMWAIAGCNDTDSAAAVLLRQLHSGQEWRGKSGKTNESFFSTRRFPLSGSLEMRISPDSTSDEYGVVFKDKSRVLLVDTNPISDVHCALAFKFPAGNHHFPQSFTQLAKSSNSSNDQFIAYIRYAGPNVLVGQAWKANSDGNIRKSKDFWGEFVLVKYEQ